MSKYINEIHTENGLDLASPITTKWYSAERGLILVIHLQLLGSPTGAFSIEAAIDQADPIPLEFPEGAVVASGSADEHIITLTEFPYPWVRIKYTPTSGSGSLNYKINVKGF